MQRVKVLYVRNLMISTTEETIKAEFSKFKPGAVDRVKKLRDYAFVHFFQREDAVTAMSVMNGRCIDGANIEVTLAKPVNKETNFRQQFFGQLDYNTESSLPFLNDEEGCRKSKGRCSSSPAVLCGPYSSPTSDPERRTYPFYSGTKLTPTNMLSLRPNQFHSAVMHLEYYCHKNNIELPEYYLYSTSSQDGKMLLIYKVVLPSFGNVFFSYFMPDKLCTSLEDAKELAAQFALMHLGEWKIT
ncbi:unnamed protein product [Ranitomeya imitator]|uniref:RRM domain-containing protein n=1 Tax=Ranitomeya imitator TaxID=111125 RepID=A0ABN9L2G1_9NEOB|nr:unnamed protein product [Ranitomeya imitator]